MTNQEPGAPEPLTSLHPITDCGKADCTPVEHWERLAMEARWVAGELRAALSHPESDTREDADLEAWRQFTMDLADGKVSEKPNGLVREAFAYAWNAAHPESGTRGLDVERLRKAFHTVSEREADAMELQTESAFYEKVAREYAASPDLSIDREGR